MTSAKELPDVCILVESTLSSLFLLIYSQFSSVCSMSESESSSGVSTPNTSDEEIEVLTDEVIDVALVEPYQNEPIRRGSPPAPSQDEIDRASRIGNTNWSV